MDHYTGYSAELESKIKKYHFPESEYTPKEDNGSVRTVRFVDLPNTIFVFGDYAVKGEALAKLLGLTDESVKPIGHIDLGPSGPIFVDDPSEQFVPKKSA